VTESVLPVISGWMLDTNPLYNSDLFLVRLGDYRCSIREVTLDGF
jgi:hypothetical protein